MKKFATLALVGTMTAAMACTAFAAEATVTLPLTLDGTEATAPKLVQYDLAAFNTNNGAAIQTITIKATAPFGEAGWEGGGGGLGFNISDDPDTGWVQIDFSVGDDIVVVDGDNLTITLDFTEAAADMSYDVEDGILQIGWWWGAGDTLTINSIDVTYAASEAEPSGDVAPVGYLAAAVALAGLAMVATKKKLA